MYTNVKQIFVEQSISCFINLFDFTFFCTSVDARRPDSSAGPGNAGEIWPGFLSGDGCRVLCRL